MENIKKNSCDKYQISHIEFFSKILQSLRKEIPFSLAISGSNEFFVRPGCVLTSSRYVLFASSLYLKSILLIQLQFNDEWTLSEFSINSFNFLGSFGFIMCSAMLIYLLL